MILPGSYIFTILLLILSMICWGSWANTFKLTGPKWRFELYYFDFSLGVFLAATIAALTFGSLGWDGFSFLDDVRNAGKRQDLFALIAGAVFNLANMLIVGAISLAGMSVAFPIGIGLALIIGVIWNYIAHPVGNPLLLGGGVLAIIAAILLNAIAYSTHSAAKAKQAAAAPVKGKAAKKASAIKGIILALVGGILMGCFYPLVEMAKESEIGLGPYAIAFIFSIGVLFSTFVYNLFFMNLPIQGDVAEISDYFKGQGRQHLLGIFGGMMWATGAVANFVAARADGAAQAGPAVSYAMGQGATLVTAIWGLFIWKEFAGAQGSVKSYLLVMLLLFTVGLAAIALAPVYAAH